MAWWKFWEKPKITALEVAEVQEKAIAEGEEYIARGEEVPIGSIEKARREGTTYTYSGSTGTAGGTVGGGGVSQIDTSGRLVSTSGVPEIITRTEAVSPIEGVRETIKQPQLIQDLTISPGFTGTGRGGLIFTKESEREQFERTNIPIWDVEAKTPQEAFIEARYAGGVYVPPETPTIATSIFGGTTKGRAEYAQAQIAEKKKVFREDIGTRREITSSISDISKFQQETSTAFSEDPFQFEGALGWTQKEIEGGTEYGLGEEYFKTSKPYAEYELGLARRKEFEEKYFDEEGYLKYDQKEFNIALGEARQKFKEELPFGVKAGAYIGDIELGTKQAVLGVTEFGRDVGVTIYGGLGVKTIRKEDIEKDLTGFKEIKERFTTYQFPFGKEIMKTPVAQPLTTGGVAFVKELFVEAPGFVAQTIPMALAAYGAGKTTLSSAGGTLKMLSPIRLKEGIFTPVQYELATTKQLPKTFSFKAKGETISFTQFKSKDFGFKLESTQFTKALEGGVTRGKTYTQLTQVPYIKIGKGGAATTFGTTGVDILSGFRGITYKTGLFKGEGTTIYESPVFEVGGMKDVQVIGYAQDIFNVGRFQVYRGVGGIDVSGFKSIKYKKTFEIGKEYYTGFESPIKTRGVGFDITGLWKDTRKAPTGVTFIKGRGTQTPLSKTFGEQAQVSVMKTGFKYPQPKGVSPIIDLKTPTTFQTTQATTIFPVSVDVRSELESVSRTRTGFRDIAWVSPKFFAETKTGVSPRISPLSKIGLAQFQPQAIAQQTGLRTPTKQITKQEMAASIIPTPSFKFDYGFGRGIFGLPLPLLPMGIFEAKKKFRKVGRKFKRTPSFFAAEAAALGFKTPKFTKKQEETGIVSRKYLGKKIIIPNLQIKPPKMKGLKDLFLVSKKKKKKKEKVNG